MPTNPMVVNLTQFNTMRTQFQQHYFLANCGTGFGGQDIQISVSSLITAVQAYMAASGTAANNVALRFVLCYDTSTSALYLRLQICAMTATSDPKKYDLVATNCAWYKIQGTSITTTTVTDLYDQNYLNSFYYTSSGTCSSSTAVHLSSDSSATIFVRNVVFPGSELLSIYSDNGNPQGAKICFASISYAANNPSPAVAYPHSLAIYLRDSSGTALLDDTTYTQDFKMKAGDYATTCPPHCNVYIYP